MAQVGEIVHFRIGLQTVRPLLVVSADGLQVTGELFLDWDFDRTEDWITKGYMKMPPSPMERTCEVRGAMLGDEIGQWRPKPVATAPIVAAAEAARVNLPTMNAPASAVAVAPPAGAGGPLRETRPPLQKITPIRRGPLK